MLAAVGSGVARVRPPGSAPAHAPSTNGSAAKVEAPKPAKAPVEEKPPLDADAIDALVQRAVDDDVASQNELESHAVSTGRTGDDVSNANSWAEVGGWIKKALNLGAETHSLASISVGDRLGYLPPDKKNPEKRAPKPVVCEVVAVGDGTVDVRSLTSKQQWTVEQDSPYLSAVE